MAEAMLDVFARRKDRFRMLEEGTYAAGWRGGELKLLEVGCAGGDAAAHLVSTLPVTVTGVDQDPELIARAAEKYAALSERCRFICADARALPFRNGSFDGAYSEAAFSVIPDKEAAAREYARVLRPGGRLLINDFCARSEPDPELRAQVSKIPCFAGVQTIPEYERILRGAGLELVSADEDYSEFMRIILHVSREYGVGPGETGGYLAQTFGSAPADSGFFKSARMSYCQLILEKPEQKSAGFCRKMGENRYFFVYFPKHLYIFFTRRCA